MKFFIPLQLLICFLTVRGDDSNRTLTYPEVIKKYKILDVQYEQARLIPYGKTDCGESLQLFIISQSKEFDPAIIHQKKYCILFINNGIHPGEPDGIDASLKLSEELLTDPKYKSLLEKVVICIIPVFNIDGSLERGCCSRVNQNGPEKYGFRANAKNLDLNRDFVKADARNTKSLISILRKWDPDVFIDTHVSNGADYQYAMTFISSQHNKYHPIQGDFMKNELTHDLYESMKNKSDEMIPYVNTYSHGIPDSGIVAFLESPRYLCGYMSLFNTFSFISEAHMLKPFPQRVNSTMNVLKSLVEVCNKYCDQIIEIRKQASEKILTEKKYYFNWLPDTNKKEMIDFKGYTIVKKQSEVTGGNRIFYDHDQPYEKKIPYYNEYYASDSIVIPKYFMIPQAWEEIVRLLGLNEVEIKRIDQDSVSEVTVTYISEYSTVDEPFEGRYLHYDVKSRSEIQKVKFRKGDYLIPLPQRNMRYILETLIPRSVDSYFCWGFFDSFLQQKEWFSSYVFEDLAADLLKKDSTLKNNFEKWKTENPKADDFSKLYWVYQHSPYFEKTYKMYPVYSVY
jgi:hypothetical protein